MITVRRPVWWMGWGITAKPVGIWAPKGAASQAASYVNLAAPGAPDITEGSAPTWDAVNGWTFNGSTYLLSGIYPPTDATLTVLVRFSNATGTGNHAIFGVTQTTTTYNGCAFQHSLTSAKRQYANDGLSNKAGRLTSGVAGVRGRRGYLNGAHDTDGWSDASQAMPTTQQLYIGGINYGGSLAQGAPCRIQAIAMYVGTLSFAEATAVDLAMQRL